MKKKQVAKKMFTPYEIELHKEHDNGLHEKKMKTGCKKCYAQKKDIKWTFN